MEDKEDFIFCTNCGTKNKADSKFCTKCGQPLVTITDEGIETDDSQAAQEIPHQSIIDSATSHLNSWTGGQGSVKVSWKEFFGQVFKPHTEKEAEEIFSAGTEKTTPSLQEISNDKVQPWLFSRILVTILLAGILLSVLTTLNTGNRMGDQIAMLVVIAIAVPMSALVLFFETNVYKNISFYRVGKIMLIGGILSLIVSIIGYHVLPNDNSLSFFSVLLIGFIEETAKVLVAAYFVRKLNVNRILNGLLIGAAVGTGFSAFENIQYMVDGYQLVSMETALQRTLLSISDHTEWCAIATAALVIAKGTGKLTSNSFWDMRFLRFFGLVMIIHMLWDWSLFDSFTNVRYIVLAIITWVTVFVMIHAGLNEVKRLQLNYQNDEQNEGD
ncbi:PrsW family glutamic-type intramembrane protease [Companilactobacillus halodurans]|uniref:PrsW family intramembrane metalloprotease n=1 Tax=Companilactobacillus halodurans TaxID=2584183 RepID=A0A5P0ZM96_9LACO|nr:PrsW family intramembrane metalloprotease [Companilactobacillus halodurans]MQS75334.1 PrsW family intramembrane metalloprotease [Companilactobacillus halodurans]MQS97411.1 PrsW family intramembrane metalloprotease [Companilactobacillus halodurans]